MKLDDEEDSPASPGKEKSDKVAILENGDAVCWACIQKSVRRL